jgi:hypothetical protein
MICRRRRCAGKIPAWGGEHFSTGIDGLKILIGFNRLKVLRGHPGASECRMHCLQSRLVTSSTSRDMSLCCIKLQSEV